jgi:hypothetical protein
VKCAHRSSQVVSDLVSLETAHHLAEHPSLLAGKDGRETLDQKAPCLCHLLGAALSKLHGTEKGQHYWEPGSSPGFWPFLSLFVSAVSLSMTKSLHLTDQDLRPWTMRVPQSQDEPPRPGLPALWPLPRTFIFLLHRGYCE